MVFFPEPLRPSEGREEDHLIVDPIEADKKAKEEQRRQQFHEEKKRSALYGALLIFINKLTNLFKESESVGIETGSLDEMGLSVQALKQFIERLKEGDQSANPKFCQQFSELWHTLHQGLQIITRTKGSTSINPHHLEALINDMENYPPNEDHKLGYYLGEYAGEKWLPIPFRDILKHLHTDHRINQEYSTLSQWSDLITEILQG